MTTGVGQWGEGGGEDRGGIDCIGQPGDNHHSTGSLVVGWERGELIDRDGLDKHFLHCGSDESTDKLCMANVLLQHIVLASVLCWSAYNGVVSDVAGVGGLTYVMFFSNPFLQMPSDIVIYDGSLAIICQTVEDGCYS